MVQQTLVLVAVGMAALSGHSVASKMSVRATYCFAPSQSCLLPPTRPPRINVLSCLSRSTTGRFSMSSSSEGHPSEGNRRQHDSEKASFGDLSIFGALRHLQTGTVQATKEVRFPGQTNLNFKIECENRAFFVKLNRKSAPHLRASDMFECEAQGLKALRFAGAYTPEPRRFGDLPDGGSYLIMEWVNMEDFAVFEPEAQAALGRMVAAMHANQPERHQFFGFGFSTQLGGHSFDNSFSDDWTDFFVETRLRPQLAAAGHMFPQQTARAALPFTHNDAVDAICARARETLAQLGPIRPSILHGDLSLANTGAIRLGEPGEDPPKYRGCLYDPAAFYGHSEFDLCLEGFPTGGTFASRQPPGAAFFEAYHKVLPRAEGHAERRAIYQLFHLLNLACANKDAEVLEAAYERVAHVMAGTALHEP